MRHIRIVSSVVRGALPVVFMAMAASAASAQRSHIGARVGYDFQSKNPVISTQLSVPMSGRLEFYPSVDVYLPDHGSMLGYNGDLKYRLPMTGPDLYVGGGLGVQTRNVSGFSNTDVGANALMGLETRKGWVHPFVEGRAFVSERNRVSVLAGLNFTIGGAR